MSNTVKERLARVLERYSFLDEFTLEEVFEGFDRYNKEITLPVAFDELKNYGFDESEVLNFVRLWRESDESYKPLEIEVNAVEIKGESFEFVVMEYSAMYWGRGDSIPEAMSNLCVSMGDFPSLDSDTVQVWLISKGTSVTGMGGFSYDRDATAPMRIK